MDKLKQVNGTMLHELQAQAAASRRRRKNLNLHDSPDDAVQRFLNDFEPGTYVRPHRHGDKWELFVRVAGAAAVLTFDDAPCVRERIVLDGSEGARVVEIPAGTWHTLVSLAPGTALFEVKRGPYDPGAPVEYARWAPPEASAEAVALERRLREAQPGDTVTP